MRCELPGRRRRRKKEEEEEEQEQFERLKFWYTNKMNINTTNIHRHKEINGTNADRYPGKYGKYGKYG